MLTRNQVLPLAIVFIGGCASADSQPGTASTDVSRVNAAAVPVGPPNGRLSLTWQTVVNDADVMPPADMSFFNSYNQPSVNAAGLVVFRARSKGGGEGACGECGGEGASSASVATTRPVAASDAAAGGGDPPLHGIYKRDMSVAGSPIVRVADNTSASQVPYPNNSMVSFIEFPSFPRIDIGSGTYAFRGNHQPVLTLADEKVGTSGIYVGQDDLLRTGASRLGAVYPQFEVPGFPGTPFDVFPGAPAVTDTTIVFKGNYTLNGIGETGDFYRVLDLSMPAGGASHIQLIANSTSTVIPGTKPPVVFGSTAPPSAANGTAVFAGFDNEDDPRFGGIYAAPLEPSPPLTTLVSIGQRVPDEDGTPGGKRFNRLGEALSFDGRFVAFWGAWGNKTRTVTLICPTEGNAARVAYCLQQYPNGFQVRVPIEQGIFVHDMVSGETRMLVETGEDFLDFLFWNFSGKVPNTADDDSDGDVEDAEPARWRSSSFVAVDSGRTPRFDVAFKAERPDGTMGIYLTGPRRPVTVVADTTMPGTQLDSSTGAADTTISNVGLERDGFRAGWLTINASMSSTTSEEGWAGIYITQVPEPER